MKSIFHRNKFTLIELLVVVAVITLLMAMLAPALTKAKHQAKLTVCVNNLRQAGVGLILYADDEDSFYPYRSINFESDNFNTTFNLKNTQNGGKDDRERLSQYVSIDDNLRCTFTRLLAGQSLANSNADVISTSYGMYFGGELVRGQPKTGMLRVGDRPEYGGETFDTLIGDLERGYSSGSVFTVTAHSGPGYQYWTRDDSTRCYTFARIDGQTSASILPRERNLFRDDGSVNRIFRRKGAPSIEMIKVPGQPTYAITTSWDWLPPAIN